MLLHTQVLRISRLSWHVSVGYKWIHTDRTAAGDDLVKGADGIWVKKDSPNLISVFLMVEDWKGNSSASLEKLTCCCIEANIANIFRYVGVKDHRNRPWSLNRALLFIEPPLPSWFFGARSTLLIPELGCSQFHEFHSIFGHILFAGWLQSPQKPYVTFPMLQTSLNFSVTCSGFVALLAST